MTEEQQAGEKFVAWLEQQVVADARGDRVQQLATKPDDLFWLGRIAPEEAAKRAGTGERGQRIDPCSAGFRFRPSVPPPWAWRASLSFVVWTKPRGATVWSKSSPIQVNFPVEIASTATNPSRFGESEIDAELRAAGIDGFQACVEVEITRDHEGHSITVVLANGSSEKRGADRNLYEVRLELEVHELEPFQLDALPDSFRYDRAVIAYGVNGGVFYEDGRLATTDTVVQQRPRAQYWDDSLGESPDLRFETLSTSPLPQLSQLMAQLKTWGEANWSEETLERRGVSESWSSEMLERAKREAHRFWMEIDRCHRGIERLNDSGVMRAFRLTNLAFSHSGKGRYDRWRPFQLGFLLANLPSLVDAEDKDRGAVDTLWFATGGGKTETYLALIVFSALWDRIRGKRSGVTAWSRFPLRMLSLQQTQRFADALAGAELARRQDGIEGDPFSLGFLVGRAGTPNRVRDDPSDGDADAGDSNMPEQYRVLLRCPFCRNSQLSMRFNRRQWRLEHQCPGPDCSWDESALPFYVVDEEIYRFLPTSVIGTLDKAASIGMQAAMRGLYAAPIACCSGEGHGYAYAPRGHTKGCIVPGCSYSLKAIDQAAELFPPSLRVQDELHLLRGGLGAIDSHYETLLDHLYRATGSPVAKLVASSATLAGYEQQVEILYDRPGHAFPQPGPAEGTSFWTSDSRYVARRFVGLAPRGQTQEFANDRTTESLQRAVRSLIDDPINTCREIGISTASVPFLLLNYGTHVVYGSTIRDVEAAARSLENQPGVEPMNVQTLTGATPLQDVRAILERLDTPEEDFAERIHVICASSMMSHGVDIEAFNVITMLGMPLSTAEFIQTTARIGRRFPGLVVVLHRMGVERDASVFRSFDVFVRHGDRFIEPIAITRKSRKVLDLTFPGLFIAHVLGVLEPQRVCAGGKQLTTITELRKFVQERGITENDALLAMCDALALDASGGDSPMLTELRQLVRATFREINDPATRARFPSEAMPSPPMISLREVETQIPVYVSMTDRRAARR